MNNYPACPLGYPLHYCLYSNPSNRYRNFEYSPNTRAASYINNSKISNYLTVGQIIALCIRFLRLY